MSNDYLKKQPTKNEKMIYDLFLHQEDLARSLWSTSSFVTALAYLAKTDPEAIAKLLTNDNQKLKEYSEKVNGFIQEIEKKRKAEEQGTSKEPAEKTEVE